MHSSLAVAHSALVVGDGDACWRMLAHGVPLMKHRIPLSKTALGGGSSRFDFIYVDEEGFKKYKPTSFADLRAAFREYKD